MAQIIINTGNAINDGTGDPLRVAFNDVNNNFSQIWSAGLVGSNITIANNTIQVTNTNGNLNLATNGVGAIVARATIAPDQNGIRYIGTATNRFNTIYSQYLDATMLALSGNLYVAGNLQVTGNTVTNNYSNANIANLNIILAAGSSNAVLSNNAGIIVRNANANLLYNYSANSWVSSIAITAPTFKGDGSNLTNVNANVNANNLLGNTLRSTIINSNLTTLGTLTQLNAVGNISTTGNVYANVYTGNIVTANILAGDGSNISNINAVSVIGYVPTATFANTALVANLAALATQSINADTALFAINANLSNYSNNAVFAQHANTATYTVQADNANSARVAGMAYELIANADISVTGNLYVGNILTNGYYYANGYPFAGGGGNGTPGGANTQVQYNNNGTFGGSSGFTFNANTNTLSVSSKVSTNAIVDGQSGTFGQISLPVVANDILNIVNNVGNLALITNATTNNLWNFDVDGNLTLPSNTSSINYANGQPYGGGTVGPDISITGNIVADGNISGSQLTAINGVVFNSKTINADFTLNGFNASSVGPVETAPGVTIDIIDGDWLIS